MENPLYNFIVSSFVSNVLQIQATVGATISILLGGKNCVIVGTCSSDCVFKGPLCKSPMISKFKWLLVALKMNVKISLL